MKLNWSVVLISLNHGVQKCKWIVASISTHNTPILFTSRPTGLQAVVCASGHLLIIIVFLS